jgi:hypothetical protein
LEAKTSALDLGVSVGRDEEMVMDPVTALIIAAVGGTSNAVAKTIIDSVAEIWHEAEERVPEEHRIEPQRQVAGPLIHAMQFHTDSHVLRQLFRELLSTAMHQGKQGLAHPGFVKVLEQLSADEAVLLYLFKEREEGDAPVVWQVFERKDSVSEWDSGVLIPEFDLESLSFKVNLKLYVQHLKQLGVVEVREFLGAPERVSVEDPMSGAFDLKVPGKNKSWDYRLSEFGAKFVEAAIPDDLDLP